MIPRWLSLWGALAMLLCMASALLSFLGVFGAQSAPALAMNAPIALQELALAGWLIIKGLDAGKAEAWANGHPAR